LLIVKLYFFISLLSCRRAVLSFLRQPEEEATAS